MIHTRRTVDGLESWPATRPGVRRMPMPSVLPTMTARPKPRPSTRRRPVPPKLVRVLPSVGGPPGTVELRLEDDKDGVDRVADVTGGVAGSARLELDVAGLPPVHDRLTVRGVLDLATGQVHDDRVRAVRMNAFARIDLHPRAKNRNACVFELRHETHALERCVARLRPGRRTRGRRRLRQRL